MATFIKVTDLGLSRGRSYVRYINVEDVSMITETSPTESNIRVKHHDSTIYVDISATEVMRLIYEASNPSVRSRSSSSSNNVSVSVSPSSNSRNPVAQHEPVSDATGFVEAK